MSLRFLNILIALLYLVLPIASIDQAYASNQTQKAMSLTEKFWFEDWRDVDFECYERLRNSVTDVEAMVVQARLESYKGRVENAISLCNWALMVRPHYAQALFLRGILLHDIGKVGSGSMDLKQFLKLTDASNKIQTRNCRARAFDLLKNHKSARREEDAILEGTAASTDDGKLFCRASAQLSRGLLKEGQAILAKLSVRHPRSPLVLSHLGYSHVQTGDFELALKEFAEAATRAPNFSANFAAWGYAFEMQRKNKEALIKYNTSLQIDPSNKFALQRRGLCNAELGNYTKALEDLNKAIKLNPDDDFTFLSRAYVHEQNGFLKDAVSDNNRVIARDPKNSTAWYQLACAKANMKEWTEAKAACEQALKLSPKYLSALRKHASIVSNMGNEKLALADYEKVLRIDPKDSHAYYARGFMLREGKQYSKSIVDLTKAIELDPSNEIYFCSRGCARVLNHDYKEAIEDCTKSIQLNSERGHPYFSRGQAYLALQKYDLAVGDFTAAIRTYADYREAFEKRAEAYKKLNKPDLAKKDLEKVKQLKLAGKD